jgi:hypothetical protein
MQHHKNGSTHCKKKTRLPDGCLPKRPILVLFGMETFWFISGHFGILCMSIWYMYFGMETFGVFVLVLVCVGIFWKTL